MKVKILTENAPKPIGPYSQAIKLDNLIFVSGQIPIDPKTGEVIKGEIIEQTRQVLKNLQAILLAGNSSLSKVVKLTVYLTELEEFPQVNQVFEEFFEEDYPAREMVQVSRLPKDVKIEVSAIALT